MFQKKSWNLCLFLNLRGWQKSWSLPLLRMARSLLPAHYFLRDLDFLRILDPCRLLRVPSPFRLSTLRHRIRGIFLNRSGRLLCLLCSGSSWAGLLRYRKPRLDPSIGRLGNRRRCCLLLRKQLRWPSFCCNWANLPWRRRSFLELPSWRGNFPRSPRRRKRSPLWQLKEKLVFS